MVEGGSCSDCGVGKYSSFGASSCTSCQSGKIAASAGSSSCSSCPTGKVSNTDFTECICAPGSQPDGSSGCEECAAGKASATAYDACSDCEDGKYTESTGSLTCSNCAAGKYSRKSGESSCNECPSELTSRLDFQDCACPLGYGAAPPTGQIAAGASVRLNVGTSSFVAPSFDILGQVTGRLEMTLFSSWGTVGDKPSNAYRFGEKEALVACRTLGLQTGYAVLLNATFIDSSNTPSGYSTPILDDLDCDPNDSSLANCLTGSSTDVDSSNSYDIGVTCKFAECGSCQPGTYSATLENRVCQNCGAGTYSDKDASTTASDCLKCPSGNYSSPGSTECSSCPAGLVQAEGGDKCVCDLGNQVRCKNA